MSKAQQLKANRERAGYTPDIRKIEVVNQEETLEEYYDNILMQEKMSKLVSEYKVNLDNVTKEFCVNTGLLTEDIPFLVLATLLQVARIFLVNYVTELEKAGAGNKKEEFLHKKQEEWLEKYKTSKSVSNAPYYASLNHIVTTRGVPYDASRYSDEFKASENFQKLFKGGNHRFSTLGHDPIFGLIFGTGNILTNTITTVPALANGKIKIPIITTNFVEYDSAGKCPRIGLMASTSQMLSSSIDRIEDDKSIVAALIKHLIHLGTDMFTPAGIHLPGLNLVLDTKTVDNITQTLIDKKTGKITKYGISTGDVLKIGVSMAISAAINMLIELIRGIYGFFSIDASNPNNKNFYKIRTEKIILISDLIASGSSLIQALFESNIKNIDFGGIMVSLRQVAKTDNLVNTLLYEFLNKETSKIYAERAQGIHLYYHE